ncbi:hypothetical protein HYC85_007852 [Camellia sinensis]|uniref:Uncharacterized protein n=1 Tax=Camellia sinensis TaxID=4442 RepID=A0A7J7HSH2_CAMSI|nr:hypothetical protein HYC85_007852 [Camellia sinensis]
MHSEEKTVSAGMVLVRNVDLQSSPNEVTALLDHNKVDESKVSEKDGTDINSGGSHVCNTKRKRNSSTHLLGSSSPLKTTKVDEGTELADRSIDLHMILNSDKSPVELQNGSTFTGIDQVGDISQQSCRNEPLALLQNGLVKGYLEAKLSVGGNANTNLSSPEEIKIHEDHVNLYSTFYDVQNASSSGNELVRGKHKITVSDIDAGSKFNEATGLPEGVAVDAGSEATLLPESVEVEGIPSPLVEGNAIVGLSKAEGTNNCEGVFDPYCFNHYATSTSGSDNFPSKSQWKIPVSEICSLDDSSKESCPEGTTVLPENAPTEGLTKARMSVGGNLHVGFGKGGTPNKRKDMDIQLDFSSPSTSDMPVNMVNIVYPIDTSFCCSDKDLNFAQEKVVVSGADNFDVGSQPCTDKDSIVHGTSRKYIKKRKVCVPVSPSPVLPQTQEEPVSGGTFMFNVELPSNTDGDLMLSENRIVESNIDTVHSARFPACSESTSVLIGNTEARPSFEATSFVGEGFTDNVSKLKQESCCPSGLGVEQKEKDDLVMITMNHQIDILDMERGGRGEKEVVAKDVEEPGMLHIDTVQQRDPSETQAPDTAQRQPVTDMEWESYLLVKDGLPSVSNTLPLYADGKGISTTNLLDEMVEFAPDKLSNMDSPEAQSIVTGSQMFNAKISLGQIPNEKSC